MRQILIAGVLAGVVVFVWGAVWHVLLPFGQAGFRHAANEQTIMSTLKQSLSEPGMYVMPGIDPNRKHTDSEELAWQQRYAAGPTALLVYHPSGEKPMSAQQLLIELASDIAAALLAALLLSQIAGPFGKRVGLVAALGLFAWLTISLSYWDWYRFPFTFVAAEGVEQVIAWLLGGLVLAKMVRGPYKSIFEP